LADLPHLRFAVGTFATWQQLRDALQDVRLGGLTFDRFNCLALERVLVDEIVAASFKQPVHIQKLAFPDNVEACGCTSGPLADRLAQRLQSGAPSLKDALGHWLIPRHAAHFQEAVEDGKILLWIQLADTDEERRAYQSLLANSSNSVGVHDLL
jgi:hypothetical protein